MLSKKYLSESSQQILSKNKKTPPLPEIKEEFKKNKHNIL